MSFSFVRAPSRGRRSSAKTSPSTLRLAVYSLLCAVSTAGCVLAPAGLSDERSSADDAGAPYERAPEERAHPELSERPDWRELLARAFAANGDIEAGYFEWRAAIERVSIAAGWPDTNLMPSLSYLFSGGSMKAWDRTTVGFGFDPMQNLSLPSKARKAGEVALAEAREAGRRFAAAKFALQRQVLDNWLELALLEERTRIQEERVALATLAAGNAEQRASVNGDQRYLLRAQVERREAEVDLEGVRAAARASRATLNAMLARDGDAPLELESALPERRAPSVGDAELISAGVENNPELQALALTASARERALELARLQYLPDFNPFMGFTGSVQQMLGVGVSLPTRLPQIRAGIREAKAMLGGARAELRQMRLDRRSSFVAALYMLRFSELQTEALTLEIGPAADQVAGSADQAYATGMATFLELIEAQRVLLDIRLAIAEARIERERRLAEIEQLGGFDVETLSGGSRVPASETETNGHE